MEVELSSEIIIRQPTKDLMKWAKHELTVKNPDYVKKIQMGRYLGGTPMNLTLYRTVSGDLHLPYGVLPSLLGSVIPLGYVRSILHPVWYGSEIIDKLYPYQTEAVKAMCLHQVGILHAPAGSGKTQMGLALIAQLGGRALWITHTNDLLNQSMKRAEKYFPENQIGVISAGKVNLGSGVTFATVQTLQNIDLQSVKDFWDVIIVDECHRVAGSTNQVTMFSKVLNNLSASRKYGLTATVHRADGMEIAMKALVGDVAYTVPQAAVAATTMTVQIQPCMLRGKFDEETEFQYTNYDGTLNFTKLINYLCNDKARNFVLGLTIKDILKAGHSCLVLSDRVEHLKTLYSILNDDDRTHCALITGAMQSKAAKAEREQAIEDMRAGQKQVLFATYRLAKEGLDIPRLDRLILATPQKDYAIITQSVGRIARTFPNKQEPVCYDFVDNMPYLYNMYKKRCTTYHKINCEIREDKG